MTATAATAPAHHWQRFTPAERVMRSGFYLAVLIAIVMVGEIVSGLVRRLFQ